MSSRGNRTGWPSHNWLFTSYHTPKGMWRVCLQGCDPIFGLDDLDVAKGLAELFGGHIEPDRLDPDAYPPYLA